MKYLVYAIVRNMPGTTGLPTGLDGRPLSFLFLGKDVAPNGLGVAFSLVPEEDAVPGTARLLAYAKVIEELHRLGTILPMRYGCLLDSETQMLDLLRRRQAVFDGALTAVEGCVEMGLRVLLPKDAAHCSPGKASLERAGSASEPSLLRPGTAYLASRRTVFAEREAWRAEAAEASERLQRAFARLFVQCHAEPAADAQGMVSLYFLVRGEDVARFRDQFRQVQESCPERLLLTGPWPPYNFVPSSPHPGA